TVTSHHHPTGNLDPLGIHPPCFVGTQECYYAADIFGHTRPTQSRDAADHFLQGLIIPEMTVSKIRHDGAGSDYIGANTPRTKLFGQVTRKRLYRTLHRCISRRTGNRDARESGRYVDDTTAIIHQGKQLLR